MEKNIIREGDTIYVAHNSEEDNSIFHLPLEEAEPVVISDTPIKAESSVAEAAKVVTSEQPVGLVDSFSNSEKLSDKDLFDELNNVSEELIKCRDRILSKIS